MVCTAVKCDVKGFWLKYSAAAEKFAPDIGLPTRLQLASSETGGKSSEPKTCRQKVSAESTPWLPVFEFVTMPVHVQSPSAARA